MFLNMYKNTFCIVYSSSSCLILSIAQHTDASLDAKAAEVASMLSGAAGDKDIGFDHNTEGSAIMGHSGIKR